MSELRNIAIKLVKRTIVPFYWLTRDAAPGFVAPPPQGRILGTQTFRAAGVFRILPTHTFRVAVTVAFYLHKLFRVAVTVAVAF